MNIKFTNKKINIVIIAIIGLIGKPDKDLIRPVVLTEKSLNNLPLECSFHDFGGSKDKLISYNKELFSIFKSSNKFIKKAHFNKSKKINKYISN